MNNESMDKWVAEYVLDLWSGQNDNIAADHSVRSHISN